MAELKELVSINVSDTKLKEILRQHRIGLSLPEVRKIRRILGRDPTLTELTIFNIQGSEHCSYKSSKRHLKQLPTKAPHVMVGVGEDAGIVEIAKIRGKKYGVIMAHESHNHPSQVVPYEGAATGIGGIVRDVLCMGGHVIAVADPLRFGDIRKNQTKLIAEGVVDGIAGYGNPIGVPNLAGDVYFDESFNTNCLVNVVALGEVREDEIIHSRAPKGAAKGYDIIIVGKPTDNSGFGGAAFASAILDEKEKEQNKGAVQEPNPFLKRHIMEATYDLFRIIQEKKWMDKIGFKDLGAGGVVCASVELAFAGGCGAEIDLDKLHVSMTNLHPRIIACSETQERMCWICHPALTKFILDHYNKKWALPEIAKGAGASCIGKTAKHGRYVVRYKGEVICDAKAKDICEGLVLNRPYKEKPIKGTEPKFSEPRDLGKVFLHILGHENVASRKPVYESYDKNVQGLSIVESGEADAGVMMPLKNRLDLTEDEKQIGIALSVDGNPRHGLISSYWQAANAVVEGMRNVAAVGATPWCVTDCLNYGDPGKSEQMGELVSGAKGLADALRGIGMKGDEKTPVPCISGNVSLYNFSKTGAIAPQAIIATLGRLQNVVKTITPTLKKTGNFLFLLGPRKNELGGSVYYDLFKTLGRNIPQPDFDAVKKEIGLVIDLVDAELVQACHDISDGGLATAIAEMCLMGRESKNIGAKIDLEHVEWKEFVKKGKKKVLRKTKPLRADQKLFSETGGFVLEIRKKDIRKAKKLAALYGVPLIQFGRTTENKKVAVLDTGKEIFSLPLSKVRDAWQNGLREKLK